MIDNIKAIQAKLENLIADITVLSNEVDKIDNRDKVSLELEKRLNEKSFDLSIKEKEYQNKLNELQAEKDELKKYSNTFAIRERQITERENKLIKELEDLDKLKLELAKRELLITDNEIEREKLEIEKKDFAIIQAKTEKERQISRDRKEMLDERERQIKIKEELLIKRLNT